MNNHSIAKILGLGQVEDSNKENLSVLLDTTTAKKSRARRARTNFNAESIKYLDEVFKTNPYPDINERERLASIINTAEERIQVWFQNKRSRHRKRITKTTRTNENNSNDDESFMSGEICYDVIPTKTSSPVLQESSYRLNSSGVSYPSSSPDINLRHQYQTVQHTNSNDAYYSSFNSFSY